MNDMDTAKLQFKVGGIEHKCLALLAKQDLTPYEIRKATGSSISIPDLRAKMKSMERQRYLLMVAQDTWSITAQGLNASIALGHVPDHAGMRRRNSADRISNGNSRELYVPKELGFTCHRPGAYDAFLLPSIMSGERVYPTGRREVV